MLVVAIASLALNVYQYASPRSVTATTTMNASSTTTATVAVTCVGAVAIVGIEFRVLSDSNLEPVVGVNVTAVNIPAICNGSPATSQTTEVFTTNGTEWIPFSGYDNYQYDFVAKYLGHTYTLTATLEPVSLTCATLYVPSGRTNVTITTGREVCG